MYEVWAICSFPEGEGGKEGGEIKGGRERGRGRGREGAREGEREGGSKGGGEGGREQGREGENKFIISFFPPKGASFQSELQGVWHLLLCVDRVLAHHSPVMVVQRWVRGWLARRALARSSNSRVR